MRPLSAAALAAALGLASGCGKFQFLRGRMVESDRTAFEVVESEMELNRRSSGRRILPTGCKVYRPTEQGLREKQHVHFRESDDREKGCFSIGWQFVYDPDWPKGWKVMVERVGYEPVWIAAEDLSPDVDRKYLLLHVKKAN
jgi:hypothetical protein